MQNKKYKEAIKSDIFSIITRASEILEVKSYVIGGFVRDYILQRGAAKDIDIVTVGNGIALAKKVASLLPNKPKVQVFKTYGTAMLVPLYYQINQKFKYLKHMVQPCWSIKIWSLNLWGLEKNLMLKIVEIQKFLKEL